MHLTTHSLKHHRAQPVNYTPLKAKNRGESIEPGSLRLGEGAIFPSAGDINPLSAALDIRKQTIQE